MNPVYQIKGKKINLEVYAIGSLQINCSIISHPETGEAVIIDPGNSALPLLSLIKIKKYKILELLHTHAHFDHIGQSSDIHIETNAPMALHGNDLFLYDTLHQQSARFMEPVSSILNPIKHLLKDQELLRYGDFLTLKVLHTPGHSPGGVSFYTENFETPIVFTGDTLFHGAIGRTDLPGGNANLLLDSIRSKIFTLPEKTIVIPGHEEETSVGEEKGNNPYFK